MTPERAKEIALKIIAWQTVRGYWGDSMMTCGERNREKAEMGISQEEWDEYFHDWFQQDSRDGSIHYFTIYEPEEEPT